MSRVVRPTKTFHGWPYILKGPRALSAKEKRRLAKKRQG